MANYYTTQEVQDYIAANYGAVTPDVYQAIVNDAVNYGVSAEQLAAATGFDPGEVSDYATSVGASLLSQEAAMNAAIDTAYAQQYGRTATDQEKAEAIAYLQGGGNSQLGMGLLTATQEGYNYDTQDIVAAYRQALGRNPTQEEFVTGMANLGIGNFDRSTLAGQEAATAAYVNALESDPFAGRYANINPYLSADQIANYNNVSQDVLGNYIQYTNPVTQQPVVASFENGELVVREGTNQLEGDQAANAIGLALNTGALTQGEYNTMIQELKAANSWSDIYDAFSKPQAVATLDPTFGFQLGVGKTLDEAKANSQGVQDLVDTVAQQIGGYMPANFTVGQLAESLGVPFQFAQSVYDQVYNNPTLIKNRTPLTVQQFQSQIPSINAQLFGREGNLATMLSPNYYSERGLETQFSPIGEGPTFRSGVAGYTQNLPTSFNFGVTPVLAPTPVFTPGTFNPNATGYDQAGNPIFGDTARYTPGTDSYLNNPIIGYTPEGTPIYGANAPVVDSGGD